ncbi:hypothetical protein VTJ83DRAFT_4457 [Remersonia thermophila]|uniref:Uncharacterized protein n=1 Tax=Remersonia thermophila TaxID=72144 RepID=A0ABR4DAS2_9PEZI
MAPTAPTAAATKRQPSSLPPTTIPVTQRAWSPSSSASSSPTSPTFPATFQHDLSAPSLRLPTTWRCGACARLNPTLDLLRPRPASDGSVAPAGDDAIYDQNGELYLFWRDDPAVSDLSVRSMWEEARWRVWKAGGELLLAEGDAVGSSSWSDED